MENIATDYSWVTACRTDDLVDNSGICVLLEGRQIAIYQHGPSGTLYAMDNWDPIARASILARGLLAEHEGELYVVSPLYKQRYSVETGICLDAPEHCVGVYPVVIDGAHIRLALPCGVA